MYSLVALGFVLAPLIGPRIRLPVLQRLVPSRWCIATVAIMFVTARLAHWLDDLGAGIIDGVQGNLHQNISEFRELSLYFLILLYVLSLLQRCATDHTGSD